MHSPVLLLSGRCGSVVERTLGFWPSCVRLPTCAGAGGKARVFVSSVLIDVIQHWLCFFPLPLQVRPRVQNPRLVPLTLDFLKQRYPFRAWIVVLYRPIFNIYPRKACLDATPAAHLYLDNKAELFVAHSEPQQNHQRARRAQLLLHRTAGWKLTGDHCERYGETIFNELGYSCASERRHAMVAVFPRAFHKSE